MRTGEMLQKEKIVRLPFRGGAARSRIARSSAPPAQRGFTIIEMMIVMAIIFILIGMAAGMYQKSIQHAREAVLKKDLQTMREAIDNYTLDKQQAPQSLQDLVDGHYLRQVPMDPITQQTDWDLHFGDSVITPDQTGGGLDDVHSKSDQISSDGKPYNTW
jgi:general secretion pathway protein G